MNHWSNFIGRHVSIKCFTRNSEQPNCDLKSYLYEYFSSINFEKKYSSSSSAKSSNGFHRDNLVEETNLCTISNFKVIKIEVNY